MALCLARWLIPVIPTTWEVEIGRIMVVYACHPNYVRGIAGPGQKLKTLEEK
jgi:hypothetical protein